MMQHGFVLALLALFVAPLNALVVGPAPRMLSRRAPLAGVLMEEPPSPPACGGT